MNNNIGPATLAAIQSLSERPPPTPKQGRGMMAWFLPYDDAGYWDFDPNKPRFKMNQRLRDIKSGELYLVSGIPPNIKIVETGEFAYSYLKVWSGDPNEQAGPVMVLSQKLMEAQGFFEPVEDPTP